MATKIPRAYLSTEVNVIITDNNSRQNLRSVYMGL